MHGATLLPSLLLGVATGLLWAPCAGPVLGLILTGAALQGPSAQTTLLLFAYAAGAATSLALALVVGGRVFTLMKRSLGAGEWIRRGLGALVLVSVAAIALGLDTGLLTQVSLSGTASLEQGIVDRFAPAPAKAANAPMAMAGPQAAMTGAPAMKGGDTAMMSGLPAMMMRADPAAGPKPAPAVALPDMGPGPALAGATEWLNSPPLTGDALKGKVVLVDFWTYSCINCLREIPYVRAWAEKYRDRGLVVIGVHAPEFAFERNADNVRKAVADLKIGYPVAIDNDYMIWRAFQNQYWPALYFVDAQGRLRDNHFGEGDYDGDERVIQQLLAEAGAANVPAGVVSVNASGAEAAADMRDVQSPETYLGYDRAANFASPGGAVSDAQHVYAIPQGLRLNEWGLSGDWTVASENAVLDDKDGALAFRFHARDLHMVLGPKADGTPVRFRVTIDGAAPGDDNRGADVNAQGEGVVDGQRLYQLVRQHDGAGGDHTFEIMFLDPGVQAYTFTFG